MGSVFCNPTDTTSIGLLGADCDGIIPEVECPCCTSCCIDGVDTGDNATTGSCFPDLPKVCEIAANNTEAITETDSLCTCTEDGSDYSCTYLEDCISCNADGTVCGIHTNGLSH